MLLLSAQILRARYTECLLQILEPGPKLDGYARKRAIPKIRYFAGRLLYLANPEDLPLICEFNRWMQWFGKNVVPVFRSLVSSAGVHSISGQWHSASLVNRMTGQFP